MYGFGKIRAAAALIAAAGAVMGTMAAVPMQTTKDSATAGRLVINGKTVFISGMNIAWNSFANDVGDYPVNISPFVSQFKQIKGAGGNAVRWWLHTDNQRCPKLNADGAVTGIGSQTINNIRTVLDSAYNYGIAVSLCLFSFDLLHGDNKTADQIAINKKFLETPANLDTYINNGLKPILAAVGNHPAIMCWEVFNEPEGMTSDAGGWSTQKTTMEHVMRFTAKIAAEVHRSTNKMASTGIHEYGKMKTYYSDEKLKAASGSNDALAYLDFYMAHYYPEYIGTSGSPFHNAASSWGMDRPVLIGEFPAQSWGSGTGYSNIQSGTAMTITAAYEYAYNNGYCGALSWSMTEGDKAKFGSFETTKPALENLSAKHRADIDLGGTEVIEPTGDQVMKVALNGLPAGNPQAELGKEGALALSGKTNLTFDMYIAPGSGTNMKILPVVKVGDSWTWSPATDYAVDLSTKTAGQWFTVTIPISGGFIPGSGSFDASKVKAFLLQFQPSGPSAYTGTIYINDVKADNEVLYNFDAMGSEWSASKWVNDAAAPVPEIAVSQVAKSSVGSTPVIAASAKRAVSRAPIATVSGKTLKITGLGNAEASVKLVNLKGKTVADFRAAGNASFGLTGIPAGNYVAELTANGKKLGSSRVVVR
jgi:hypothetical protein